MEETRISLQRENDQNSSDKDKWPSLSIIICTHDRVDWTKRALESFYEQTVSPDSFEIIVVDNDLKPTPEIEKLVAEASNRLRVKYLHEPKLGLSNARISGGQFAQTDYFGYFDDDAKAPPEYVETLLQTLKEHSPDICGGPIYPFYLTPKPAWFKDEYSTSLCLGKSRFLKKNEFLLGPNIIFRHGLLDQTGWFDPKFGMKGKKVWFGEETMVQINAWDKKPDLKVYFNQNLFVYHLVTADKMKLRGRMYRSYRMGKATPYLWIPESEIRKHQRRSIYALFRLMIDAAFFTLSNLIVRDKKKHPYWQNVIYEASNTYSGPIGTQVRFINDLFFLKDQTYEEK